MRITIETDQNVLIVDSANNQAVVISKLFGFVAVVTIPELIVILEGIARGRK